MKNIINPILILIVLILMGCYNRYNAPLIWEGTAYPIIKPEIPKNYCKSERRVRILVVDNRLSNVGKIIPNAKYPSEVILDNELSNVEYFIGSRMCTYLNESGIKCANNKNNGLLIEDDFQLKITVNVVTPDVRGAFWMNAYGPTELDIKLIKSKSNSTIFEKTYDEVAMDGDDDIPLPWYSAVTIEQAGKLVVATSVKRIADNVVKDVCKIIQ